MIYFGELKEKKGIVNIIKDRCKGCSFCVEYCPRDVLEMSEEFNVKGYHPPRVINPDNCCYCQLCEAICPEFAIFVTLREEEEREREKEISRP
ncbi:MAG: 4Fe-4S binding protein [Candidatus Aminicenantes bacterium]|nr:4Fe-4S binding protein [Candidatus Aminicenantes bacterium]